MEKKDLELISFLADPDNISDFIGVAITQSLGFSLTEDGTWVKIDT
jgi:hypothetical protein